MLVLYLLVVFVFISPNYSIDSSTRDSIREPREALPPPPESPSETPFEVPFFTQPPINEPTMDAMMRSILTQMGILTTETPVQRIFVRFTYEPVTKSTSKIASKPLEKMQNSSLSTLDLLLQRLGNGTRSRSQN